MAPALQLPYELVFQYPDHEEVEVVSAAERQAGQFIGALITRGSDVWQIYRFVVDDPPTQRYLCAASLVLDTHSRPPFGSPDGPAYYMSTPMIKTQLEKLLRELRPRERWQKRVTAKELASYALDNLDRTSADPRVWRAVDLARVAWPRLS